MLKKGFLSLAPGLALAGVVAPTAFLLCHALSRTFTAQNYFFSPILAAILLGILVKNLFPIDARFDGGIQFGMKTLLRLGIILMGIRLSIVTVAHIGAIAAVLVGICIAAGLLATIRLARKIGVPDSLGVLIAAGTSICGVTAIIATSPVIGAKEEETAYAVGTITLFGILASLTYPYMTELVMHLPVQSAGVFIGTAVHDTSQVVAASLIYDQLWNRTTVSGLSGSDIAITIKLVRNAAMILVIPILAAMHSRTSRRSRAAEKINIMNYIPFFVFGYIGMAVVRSAGDFLWGADSRLWSSAHHIIQNAGMVCVTLAITCAGLNTDVRRLLRLGYRPLLCGLCAAFLVGAVAWGLVVVFGKSLAF